MSVAVIPRIRGRAVAGARPAVLPVLDVEVGGVLLRLLQPGHRVVAAVGVVGRVVGRPQGRAVDRREEVLHAFW